MTPALIFFVFGLIIGSFLNVVIYRLNTKRSLGGRSACLSCRRKLSWYELIPLLSFIALQGRCKNCQTRISIQYPLVELAAGLIFAALFLKLRHIFFMDALTFAAIYIYHSLMFSLLLVIAAYDLRHKIIPDKLSLLFGIFAFLGLFFFDFSGSPLFYPHLPSIWEFLSGILTALPFALFWLLSAGTWMGLGDAKLALGIGWFLGFSLALSALLVAFWSGAIIGLSLIILFKHYGMKSEIPFAPYLVWGAFLTFIFELRLWAGS